MARRDSWARIRISMLAGFAGSLVHGAFMLVKSRLGLFADFQPYLDLQRALSQLIDVSVHPAVPWVLSFANGTIVLGILFARTRRLIPGRGGAQKGIVFGILGWLLVGTVFFPLLGRGFFALSAGHGALPALYTLAMVLSYSVTLGLVYESLTRRLIR